MLNRREHPPGSGKDVAIQLQEIEQQGKASREDLEQATETLTLKSEALNAQELTWRFYEQVKDRPDYLIMLNP